MLPSLSVLDIPYDVLCEISGHLDYGTALTFAYTCKDVARATLGGVQLRSNPLQGVERIQDVIDAECPSVHAFAACVAACSGPHYHIYNYKSNQPFLAGFTDPIFSMIEALYTERRFYGKKHPVEMQFTIWAIRVVFSCEYPHRVLGLQSITQKTKPSYVHRPIFEQIAAHPCLKGHFADPNGKVATGLCRIFPVALHAWSGHIYEKITRTYSLSLAGLFLPSAMAVNKLSRSSRILILMVAPERAIALGISMKPNECWGASDISQCIDQGVADDVVLRWMIAHRDVASPALGDEIGSTKTFVLRDYAIFARFEQAIFDALALQWKIVRHIEKCTVESVVSRIKRKDYAGMPQPCDLFRLIPPLNRCTALKSTRVLFVTYSMDVYWIHCPRKSRILLWHLHLVSLVHMPKKR